MTLQTAESSGITPHSQGFDYRLIEVDGDLKVRYLLHIDTSYPSQSRAKAEVWSARDLRWNEVAHLRSREWAIADLGCHGIRDTTAQEQILEAVDALKAQVITVLT